MTQADSRQLVRGVLDLVRAGNIDAAEARCRELLEREGSDVNLVALLGAVLLKKEQFAEAEQWLLKATVLEPKFARPFEDLGALCLVRNEPERAVEYFRTARALSGDSETLMRGLAVALRRSGRATEADALRPQGASTVASPLESAARLHAAGDLAAAERQCQAVLAKDPDNLAALRLLAMIATSGDRHVAAESLLRRIVAAAPGSAQARQDLGRFLGEQGRYPEAVDALERAVNIDGDDAAAAGSLADMLAVVGRPADALANYERCLRLDPANRSAMLGRGHMLRILGDAAGALDAYRNCVETYSTSGEAWWHLASLRGYAFSDEDIACMQQALDAPDNQDPAYFLHFALARAYEQRSDYRAAWQHYTTGNRLKRELVSYDPVETETQSKKIRAAFVKETFSRTNAQTPDERTPIFIVGMPRSGSTLIEQILASHSMVNGLGELPYIIMLSRTLAARHGQATEYPDVVNEFGATELTGLGRSYLYHAKAHGTEDRPFFTDKMPANFSHAGFIKLILPHAKIIDARRDPMATCVANYRQLFAQGKNQSYDLVELGEYYLQYAATMQHWDQVIPGAVLRVSYEAVVADLDAEVRRLLDFCGLPFEGDCVRFHQSERPVNTASAEQVRQPIYDDALQFWKHYEAELDELQEVLGPIL